MSKLSQIEQKIKEVCPWLFELTFGCVIDVNGTPRTIYKVDREGNYFILLGESQFVISKETMELSKVITILGHPLQLSDLLYTIKSVNENNQEKGVSFDLGGSELLLMSRSPLKVENSVSYDLTKSLRENLENEELCDFIHQLICK